MSGKRFQCAFRHGVHGERSSETLDIKNVGGLRILGSGACPQRTLRASPEVVKTLPAGRTQESAGRLVGAFRDGDAKLVVQFVRRPGRDGSVPAADEYRGDRADIWIEPRFDAPLDPTEERFRRSQVLLAR